MFKLLTVTAVAGLLAFPANAREWTKEELAAGMQKFEYSRYVPSSELRALESLYAVRANCTPYDDEIRVRVVKKSEHGSVEFVPEEVLPTFKDDSKFAKCNDKKVTAIIVKYKSADGYTGVDNFTILAMFPSGMAREINFKMIVR